VTRRLRAAFAAFRTGLTYSDGYQHGQDDADATDNALRAALPAIIDTHLNARAATQPVPARNVRHLTLVSGGAR
jgi:hypothetical protein